VEHDRLSEHQSVVQGDEVELPPDDPDHKSMPVRAGKREPTAQERAAEPDAAEEE
jgi:hypothetical protein